MDLKQNYRKETNLEVYAGTSEKYPSYSDKYVEWLEEQLRIGVVSQQRELLAFRKWQKDNWKDVYLYSDELMISEFKKANCSQQRELLLAYENYTSKMITGKTNDRTAKSLVNDFLAIYSG
jgi:hypothetical protein